MVSLRIGRMRAPSSVFKRKSFKKSLRGKENDPTSKRNIEESISHSSDQSTTDESMGSSDGNNIDKSIVVHLIGLTDSGGNKFTYKPANRRPSLRKSSSNGSFKISDSVREAIQKRTSSVYRRRSSIRGQGVTFLDEVLGLTPRHIVTQTYYRPRTSIEERKTMYYSSKDILLFERELLYEKVEAEIKAIERQKKKEQDGDVSIEDEDSDNEPLDLEQVQKLVQKVRNRLNLEQYTKEDAML
mmetsp:Transcript_23756/g.47184  ORF Transcript_23756/g.47184 Transcript_23756/m.47184 type:complete len:242 (+) Transcript_23756:294-1019(+)